MDADDETEEQQDGLPKLSVKIQQEDGEEVEEVQKKIQKNIKKKFLMNRWKKVYALKKERKHKSKQDTLKRQRKLICLQRATPWSAMAITSCLSSQPRNKGR